jgi:hypothetical protein
MTTKGLEDQSLSSSGISLFFEAEPSMELQDYANTVDTAATVMICQRKETDEKKQMPLANISIPALGKFGSKVFRPWIYF